MDLTDDELRETNTNTIEYKYRQVYKEMCRYMKLYNEAAEENERLRRLIGKEVDEMLEG